jgi:hypothetical protein
MLKSQTYLPNKKPLAGLFYFAVGFRGAVAFLEVGASAAAGSAISSAGA